MNKECKIEIKAAKPENAAELLAIYKYYVENTAITFEIQTPTLEEFTARIEKTLKKYPYIVAVADGKIVGYAYAGPFKGRAAYDWAIETSIYVQKECRKMGIGRILLQKLEKILTKQNILNVYACITYADVEDEYLTRASVHFHEKMGYRMVGIFNKCGHKFNRWYSMCWMEKMLGEHNPNQPKVIEFNENMID